MRNPVLPFNPMRKTDDEAPRATPAPDGGGEILRLEAKAAAASRSAPSTPELRTLVRFAIGRGYYETWNKPAEPGVRPCPSGKTSTDAS